MEHGFKTVRGEVIANGSIIEQVKFLTWRRKYLVFAAKHLREIPADETRPTCDQDLLRHVNLQALG